VTLAKSGNFVSLLCVSAVTVCSAILLQPPSAGAAADAQTIERGAYLTTAGDCVSCHTAPGGKRFAGGLYMPTPFGEISTPNITPDKTTGIGDWSDDEFYRAMHEGIGRHNEYLYPVFPFPWFTRVTRDDALAIKAYLFSLPAENAPRKALRLAFPFNLRDSLLAWRTAFFKPETFVADPKLSKEINRGAYLVDGLGHCGECHNHNSLFGASNLSGRLEGGQIESWYAPNITSDGHEGIGTWSIDQIATFLRSGSAPAGGVALGPMKETVEASLRHLSEQDLQAIAAYLKSVTGRETYKPSGAQTATTKGLQTYLSYCASCHHLDGLGVPGIIPALAGNGAVKSEGPENVIRVVLGGMEASHGLAPMPAVGVGMSDQEVAEVVNYIRTAWGNGAPANAGAGSAGDIRAKTHTLLAGNPVGGCPTVADPKLADIVAGPSVRDQLKGVPFAKMLDRIDLILPKMKASGAAADEIVNALTMVYCPIALADAVSPIEGAGLLGSFSGLVYGQIKNGPQAN
jgi:mono/diheme cytochrome c family protein